MAFEASIVVAFSLERDGGAEACYAGSDDDDTERHCCGCCCGCENVEGEEVEEKTYQLVFTHKDLMVRVASVGDRRPEP